MRVCNKCGKQFEKVEGCNQVKCSCGNYQCYLCSKNVLSDHSHFVGYGGKGTCKLFDNPKIEEKIAEAENETVRRLLRNVPGLKSSDLRI